MRKITTTQLIQEFLEKGKLDKFRKNIFRTVAEEGIIQECEKSLEIEFVDMNYEQFLYVIETITKAREKSNYAAPYEIYYTIFRLVSQMFTYYSQNICPMRNPFLDENATKAYSEYLKKCKRFTMDDFKKMTDRLHCEYVGDYADYLELILQLAYCGFQSPKEILMLKKEDVNFHSRIAIVNGHKIQISERCMQLLLKFEYLDSIEAGTVAKTYYMKPWRGSYFKFNLRPSSVAAFDDKNIELVATSMISKKFIERIAQDEYVGIKFSTITLFGFYNYCSSKVGDEKMGILLSSERNREMNSLLAELLKEYDFRTTMDVSRLKVCMRVFLPTVLL